MALVNIKNLNNADPLSLGRAKDWKPEDLALLLKNEAKVNEVGYVHIPKSKLAGTVPLGFSEKRPAQLEIIGTNLKITGKGRNKRLIHSA